MVHSCIPEIGIEDYAHQLRYMDGRRTALFGSLELTFRCNNRCVHCYVNKAVNDMAEKEKELDYTEICHLLDDLAENGVLWILFTGGEPLIREDFTDIYLYAKKRGFLITVFTNGTLVTPTLLDVFEEFPPHSIEITLYGITKETYEKVTRRNGSYERCMSAVNRLLDRGLPLKLKTTVTTINQHEFFEIKQFVVDLGLEFRFDALINARLDGSRGVTQYRLSPQEVLELDMSDSRRGPEFVRLHERISSLSFPTDSIFRCGGGINSFHIDPYGRLTLCNMVRKPSYNLREGSFREGWDRFLPDIRKQAYRTHCKCRNCDLASICDQCPGWGELENGNAEMPAEYLCQITKLRAKAFGILE